MTIAFACPGCAHPFKRPVTLAGKAARCKYCGRTFRIPSPRAAVAPALAPPPPIAKELEPDSDIPLAPDFDFEVDEAPHRPEPKPLAMPPVNLGPRRRPSAPEPNGKGYAKRKSDPGVPPWQQVPIGRLVLLGVAFFLAFVGVKSAITAIQRNMGGGGGSADLSALTSGMDADLPIRADVIARHDPMLRQLRENWEEMRRIYAGVDSRADLQAAAPKLEGVAGRMAALEKDGNALPPMNAAEDQLLLEKHGPDTKTALEGIRAEIERIRRIPELAGGDFGPALHAVEGGIAQIDQQFEEHKRRKLDNQYVTISITGLPSREACEIVGEKLQATARKAAGDAARISLSTNIPQGTIEATILGVPDPLALAKAIDFGRISGTSTRRVEVEAYEIPAAELAARAKANSPSGRFAKALDDLRSADTGARRSGLNGLGAIHRDEPATLVSRKSEILPLITANFDDPDGGVRDEAFRLLAALSWPEAVDAILQATKSPTFEVRNAALGSIEALARDDRRRLALEAKHEAVARALVDLAGSDPDGRIRSSSLARLKMLGWPEAVPAMAAALTAPMPDARHEAVRQLGAFLREKPEAARTGRAELLAALEAMDGPGPHPYAGDVTRLLREQAPTWPEAVPTLVKMAGAGAREIRQSALQNLLDLERQQPGSMSEHRAAIVAGLVRCLHDREGHLGGDAIRFLATTDWPEALPALIRALADPIVPELREHAFRQLMDLNRSKPDQLAAQRDVLVPTLEALTNLEDPRSWEVMLEFLGQLDIPEVVPAGLLALKAQNRDLRMIAFRRIQDAYRRFPNRWKARRDVLAPALTGLLSEPDRNVRGEAALMLLEIAGPEDVPALADFLKGEDGHGRAEVMEGLARIGDPRAAEAIATYLGRDGDRAVRCLVALGPGAEGAARNALGSPDGQVRSRACDALREIGTRGSIPALRRVANDPDQNVANKAVEAIQAIGNRRG